MRNLLTIIIPFLITTTGHTQLFVYDLERQELTALKKAVETLFHHQCSEVKNIKNYYGLDLETCLPETITNTLKVQTPQLQGSNCYNYSLYPLGIMDSLRMVSNNEVNDLYFTEDSPFCNKITGTSEPRTGEVIAIGNQYQVFHSFVFLTSKYVLNKNGTSPLTPWEVTSLEHVFKRWNVEGWGAKTSRYNCKPTNHSSPSELRSAFRKIFEFTQSLSLFSTGDTNLAYLTSAISDLTKNLSDEEMKFLIEQANNPLVRIKIYDVINSFYSLIHLMNSNKANNLGKYLSLKAQVFEYLLMVDKILSYTSETFGFEEFLKFSELSQYCYQKLESKICQLRR